MTPPIRLAFALLAGTPSGFAAGIPTLAPLEVRADPTDFAGIADTATEGMVTARQLATRPLLRPGETLEVVPGLIVTQHSGDGKANQYFLRGYNLDHGTDFATWVEGMPVNQPSHAHGQGYADLNFLIPELVDRVRYRKGPYAVEDGDFAAAGSARIDYFRVLPARFAELTAGGDGYRRGLVAGSPALGAGHLLYGLEWLGNDGPWEVPENLSRLNGVLKYSAGARENGWSVAALAYRARWTATDQVPRRAVTAGLVGRYGSLDPGDGGLTHRYSLSADWARTDAAGASRLQAYAVDYRLGLFSNFTYFLDDPVNGDQFEQADDRRTLGAAGEHRFSGGFAERDSQTRVGFALRHDRIAPVGLYLTRARQRLATVREDRVEQASFGLYVENQTRWLPKFRSTIGWREDFYHFRVASDLAANSGARDDRLGGPKLALVFGPWAQTEFYFDAGRGFHSNDARGATTTLNPDPRAPGYLGPVAPVTPLVSATGYEIGLRAAPLPGLQATLALWRLDVDSELRFVGDAGTTEAGRPARRHGLEFSGDWRPAEWLTLDLDLALTRARFADADPAGSLIPGALARVASFSAGVDAGGAWFGGLRLRHFGPRPLTEDGAARSKASTLVNLRVGYRIERDLSVTLDALNLFDRKVSDIDYFYDSRLAGEATPVSDIHTHPAEPRTLRLGLRYRF